MIVSVLLVLFYLFWGVISLIAQGEGRVKERIRSYDLFNLIPNYKFFCPNPIRCDYHLYYRSPLAEDAYTEWEEVVIGRRSLVWGVIWNPRKRDRKVFYKVVKIIRKSQRDRVKGGRIASPLYLSLVNYVRRYAGMQSGEPVQVRITSRQDLDASSVEKIIYISSMHTSTS